MRIKSVRTYRRNLALTKPYTIAYQTTTAVENIFLELQLDNGMIGIGAANPDPDVVGETPEQTFQNLQSEWIAGLAGRDIRLFLSLIDEAGQQFPNAPGTLSALDMALHDAFGQYLDVPVVQFYGQRIRSLPTSVTIGIMNVADTLTEAAEYVRQGFRVLKIKTGLVVDEDIERILKLRAMYGHRLTIRVDANQGYSLADLGRFLSATHAADLELIEQPLVVGQESDLLTLPDAIRRKLVADESLHGPEAALTLARQPQPFGIYNVKLMKCGGIRAALAVATIAQTARISLFWGCNDESRVSITAALHTAFACPASRYLDLDGSLDLAEDIVSGGFVVEEGMMRLSGGAGLGLTPYTVMQAMLPIFPFGQQFNDKMGTYPLPETDRLVETDTHYEHEIALKRQLLTDRLTYYYQALPGYETAQWDVLDAVLHNLAKFSPDQFTLRQEGDRWHWHNHRLGEAITFTFGDWATLPLDPLDWVGRQVQEDLILLANDDRETGAVTLVAGQLCFGNGWCLDEKMGLPFWQIHAPIIPMVEPMIRAAQKLMERLPVGRPVWRANWSVKVTDQLDMTSRHTPALDQLLTDRLPGLTPDTIGDQLYLRVERQTLTRLPRSGAILFGIHTYQNLIAREVAARPGGADRLARVFSTAPPALLDYKGMTHFMPALLTYLNQPSHPATP